MTVEEIYHEIMNMDLAERKRLYDMLGVVEIRPTLPVEEADSLLKAMDKNKERRTLQDLDDVIARRKAAVRL